MDQWVLYRWYDEFLSSMTDISYENMIGSSGFPSGKIFA